MQFLGSLKEKINLLFFLCLLCFTDFSNSQYITVINVTTDTTTVVDGASHSLTCLVIGGPVTQIFWYFEEQIISNSEPHYSISFDSLQIIAFSSADEGAYSCVAENNRGRILSSSLQLQLAYFNVDRTKLPDFQILLMTSGFSLACPLSAFDSLPPPKVTWTHEGVLVNIIYPLVVTLDYELIFTTVKSSDSGEYACDVTNSLLGMNEVFDVAAVTITQDSTIGEFFITPDNKTVIEGDDVSFQCIITQGSTINPVEWRFGDEILDSQRILLSPNSFILTIQDVRKGDMGSYSCALSTSMSDRQYFTLSVISRPDIISNQSLYSELPEGSNISLSCQSVGAPPLSYSWYYNADPLDSTLLEEIEILSVSTTDSGTYQCFVENSAGVDTNAFIINIKTLIPQFTSLQNDILTFVGRNFTFSCEATSAATLSYVFSVNNQTLPTTGYLQHNGTHYSVIGAAKSHSGVYTCGVSTSIGAISHTFTVHVVDVTTPNTSLITNTTVFANDTVQLPCGAVKDETYPTLVLNYRWEVDGVGVNTSDGHFQLTGNHGDLQINRAVLTDAGVYTCIAITSDTNLTLDSYLETVIGSTVFTVATVAGQPFNLEVEIHNSTSVRISWSPPANDGGVAIQSYIVEYASENSWLTADMRIFTFITFSVCPGYTYIFHVLAVNDVGKSEASDSTTIDIPSFVPTSSPTNLSVKSALFQLSLEWEIPSSPTKCDISIINHSILYYALPQTSPRLAYTGSSELSFILSGLNPSTSFNISVAFVNVAGIGEYSQYISAKTADLLAEPSSFELESYGTGKIAVYFIAPPSHTVITGYKLLCISQLGGVINRTLGPETASQLTIISDFTTQDMNYSCTVSAFNAGGDGLLSVTKCVTPSSRKVPDPPLSLDITTSGSYTATFDWTFLDDTTNFILILYYKYSLTPHALRRTIYYISGDPSYSNSSLFAGVDYSVRLAGENDDGIGFNQTSEFSLPPGRPGVPLLFVTEELDVVTLSWSILHDGGSNITNVTVENLFDSTWITLATYENNKNSSHRLTNAEKGFEFRIVISNYFGRTESPPVSIDSTTEPVSTLYIIFIAVLLTSTLIVITSLLICGLYYFSYWRQQKKSHSLSVSGNNKQSLDEESRMFRNINNTPNQRTDKFPARHSETSSDSTAADNPPSYHSSNPSRDSKASYGSKSSKSSSSSRRKVQVIEQRQAYVSRGVLAQPGKIQSDNLAHKSVVFAGHRAQTSGDSDSSWTNTFNRQVKDSPTPINLEEYSPPLPKRKGNSQPHPLNLTTNSYTNMLPGRGTELWDPRTEDEYPILISHKKSRSDDISDHYSTVFDETPHPPPARSNKLTSSKHKIRSKSPMSFLAQKLSPIKARIPADAPTPMGASPSDSPSNCIQNVISDRVFVNHLRMPSPHFVEHQHSDSVPSQQTSSLSSAC